MVELAIEVLFTCCHTVLGFMGDNDRNTCPTCHTTYRLHQFTDLTDRLRHKMVFEITKDKD